MAHTKSKVTKKTSAKATKPRRERKPSLARILVEKGYLSSEYAMSYQSSLSVKDIDLPPPWDLPSRVFENPIAISQNKIGLLHPLLKEHPFVQKVEADIGMEIPAGGIEKNVSGYRSTDKATFWHAEDLCTAEHWQDLLATRDFTTPQNILDATRKALEKNALTPKIVRAILEALGFEQPAERRAVFESLTKPRSVTDWKGKNERWPLNCRANIPPDPQEYGALLWGIILGMDANWFAVTKSGLEWTDEGRAVFALPEGEHFHFLF